MKGRILSGMRPTGKLHIGHYFGALENWLKQMPEYDCFFEIADLHALTENAEKKDVCCHSVDLALDYLACGIDPQKSVIFLQSAVPAHSELHLLLSMVTPVSWLERCPTYKDQIAQLDLGPNVTYGLLGYPVLMTTDIILYKADTVPIGKDQLPHLELTREIVRRFNFLFNREVFVEPKEKLTEIPLLLGLDGRKMSKSYNNSILLSEEEDQLWEKVRNMVTDPARIKKTDLGHPEVCSVFSYQKIFNCAAVSGIEADCRAAKIGCVQCKKNLNQMISSFITPIRDRRKKLMENPALLREIIEAGNKKARIVAEATLAEVRDAMKIGFKV
ncbi:MAG: tryptophan--tRNA ligase [Candidatus Wallbacteria bacterium]|nr:tryptophan--tRNA ligase [Candidatus Wallbacteria bacterium]